MFKSPQMNPIQKKKKKKKEKKKKNSTNEINLKGTLKFY